MNAASRYRKSTCAFVLVLWVGSAAIAQETRSYLPARQVSGTIHAWGSEQMAQLLRLWERRFHDYQPGVTFDEHLRGTVSALGGVYSGVADIALMGREVWPEERLAYTQVLGYAPPEIQVATGSYDVPTKADALVIFVHRTNPLARVTLPQLDAIFGAEHRRGSANIRSWGELGVTGVWATHPIHPYGYRLDNAAAIFFRNTVMQGSLKWNPDIREFSNRNTSYGQRIDAGQLILNALGNDPYGMAISNPHYATPEVRAVALVAGSGGPSVDATRATVQNRTYPLTRAVYIVFDRRTKNAAVGEFLRFVVSVEGQQQVASEGAYLPLPTKMAAQQRSALDRVLQSDGTTGK